MTKKAATKTNPKKKTNPAGVKVIYRNKKNPLDTAGIVKTAAVASVGAIITNAAADMLLGVFPLTGMLRIAARAGLGFALGMAAEKVVSKEYATALAVGGVSSAASELYQQFIPSLAAGGRIQVQPAPAQAALPAAGMADIYGMNDITEIPADYL